MPSDKKSVDDAKRSAGFFAAELVKNNMVVGLGTGSTVSFFISRLIEKKKSGLSFTAVATSESSFKQASSGGIVMADIDTITTIDLAVDGADEIDPQKRMIKGGGGALLREKIVASMAKDMVVVVDSDKLVPHLGRFPLPVEILPFGFFSTLSKIKKLGFEGVLRKKGDAFYVTDNGNYIVDISLKYPVDNPEKIHETIKAIPGVLETGFFFNLAKKVIVGYNDGHVEVLK